MRAEWTVKPDKGSRARDGWLTHLSVSPAEMVQRHQMDESLIAAPKDPGSRSYSARTVTSAVRWQGKKCSGQRHQYLQQELLYNIAHKPNIPNNVNFIKRVAPGKKKIDIHYKRRNRKAKEKIHMGFD